VGAVKLVIFIAEEIPYSYFWPSLSDINILEKEMKRICFSLDLFIDIIFVYL